MRHFRGARFGAGGGGGGGAVLSVFGRVGAIIAVAGDYLASQVNNDSGVAGATVADALDTLNASISQSLAQVLAVGNGTGGSDIVVDEADQIRFDRADGRDNTTLERLAGQFRIEGGDAQAATGFNGVSIVLSPGAGDGAGVRGDIDADAAKIVNLADPTLSQDAATKVYVDDGIYPWQTWGGTTVGNSAGGQRFLPILPSLASGAIEADSQWPCAATGFLRNCYFNLEVALAVANLTITPRINGVNQAALQFVILAGALTGNSGAAKVAVTAGAKISIGIVASAADNSTSRPRAGIGFSRG